MDNTQTQSVFGIIYKATNIVNGKVYIGQTVKTLRRRKKQHEQTHTDKRFFQSAIAKYGKENFIWEEIDKAFSKEELNEKEKEWIWLNKSNDSQFGYNLNEGGNGNNGYKLTEQGRKNLSDSHKGYVPTEEARINLSRAIKESYKNPNRKSVKGRKQSQEEIEKRRKALKGIPCSDIKKIKISKAHKGRKHSLISRKHMSEAHLGKPSCRKGKKQPKDAVRKQQIIVTQHKDLDIPKLIELRNQGYSFQKLSEIFNCSFKIIRTRLKNPQKYIDIQQESLKCL